MKRKNSYYINSVLAVCAGLAFLFEGESLPFQLLFNVGLFGLSGSLTNSLAIHMLFERIPLVYGSGIIALNFAEIKRDLEELMIREFFNREQIERFLSAELQAGELDLAKLGSSIDFDVLFDKFQAALAQNFAGNPLAQMALPLLEVNRAKIVKAMRRAVDEELQNPELAAKLKGKFGQGLSSDFETRVRALIQGRLAELTPQMIKDIIRHMMESKLLWLVLWGALIGALLGLLSALLRFYL